jgi:hypothetical protein
LVGGSSPSGPTTLFVNKISILANEISALSSERLFVSDAFCYLWIHL